MEIKLNSKRSDLAEGRTTCMGFAFCNVTKTEIEGVDAISACKDYLNDFVWSEKFKSDSEKIHGYKHNYVGFFENKKQSTTMLISILNNLSGNWSKHSQHVELMENTYKNIAKLLNSVEEKLNVKFKTRIKKVDNNLYVIQFSKFWVSETALISLFSLLCRLAYLYPNVKTLENLKTPDNDIIKLLGLGIKQIHNTILQVLKVDVFNFTNAQTSISVVHNYGCLSGDFTQYLKQF
jgi:hypothetical protein